MFIDKLKQAIEDEYKAYHFYKSMYELTNDPLWQDFIKHAYEDEKSHYEMFQQLYYMLTGTICTKPKETIAVLRLERMCANGLLLDELEGIDTYKEMLLTIPIQQAYNPIFIALHDEMEHAIRFSTMYNAL